MRYKCVGSPDCMKTFEFGHALRAHIASCESAQKILRHKADIQKLEYEIAIDHPALHGIKGNKYYPTFASLDQSLKFNFADRFRFTPLEAKYYTPGSDKMVPQRRILRAVSSNVLNSAQVKRIMEHPQ